MAERRTSRAAVVSGLFFVAAGIVFLLERLEVVDIRLRVLWPVLLIVLGLAVLVGGRRAPPA